MARKKKEMKTFTQKVKYFPGWLSGLEEEYLCKMAKNGWMLKDICKETVYHFERCTPQNAVFAVEHLGKRPSIAEDIAANCNAGWDFIGLFGKKRYYVCDPALAPAHPSANVESESSRQSTTVTNLTTLLLLNIPGTLYCLLYTVLLVLTNGLSLIGLFSYQFIYPIGAVLGIFSMYTFLRWIMAIKRRLNKLNPQD